MFDDELYEKTWVMLEGLQDEFERFARGERSMEPRRAKCLCRLIDSLRPLLRFPLLPEHAARFRKR